ncbi:MAG: 16S rRNA (adenine(1518)-N(6)/adenine(1519)-N(6))-dimethyltransferase RsmA [Burkholderiales bacterium]|nr:MAG: 16S rRNA (adenine(1518)-N(6)/adenine(1519)-N(6))-dimethyltransferase RsmA [Betaproteobacteria bacterium]TAG71682.1 MAG: 16S rRNA (adenine(1518)-N(6)/adenine(1519)-N(6))-dimethyltransferase RsmA [Burkholderiales bacterium]
MSESPPYSGAHRARKRFGQNFLVDRSYIRQIADSVNAKPGDHIVEIGPGQAALTRELIKDCGSIDAVEIDRDLVARLQSEFDPAQLRLHQADALEFDFESLPSPLRIVGNLPYNISTPILFRLCELESHIADMTFMLQKEVVDRMVAKGGDDARGRLSIMLQYRFKVEKQFDVPPSAFKPVPAVDSSIVRLTPLREKRLRPKDEAFFAQLVTQAFTQRRKMLRKSLGQWISNEGFEATNVNAQARAEELSTEEFVALSDWVSAQRKSEGEEDRQ